MSDGTDKTVASQGMVRGEKSLRLDRARVLADSLGIECRMTKGNKE